MNDTFYELLSTLCKPGQDPIVLALAFDEVDDPSDPNLVTLQRELVYGLCSAASAEIYQHIRDITPNPTDTDYYKPAFKTIRTGEMEYQLHPGLLLPKEGDYNSLVTLIHTIESERAASLPPSAPKLTLDPHTAEVIQASILRRPTSTVRLLLPFSHNNQNYPTVIVTLPASSHPQSSQAYKTITSALNRIQAETRDGNNLRLGWRINKQRPTKGGPTAYDLTFFDNSRQGRDELVTETVNRLREALSAAGISLVIN